jgi:hypothetical protein
VVAYIDGFVTENCVQWRALVLAVLNLWVLLPGALSP